MSVGGESPAAFLTRPPRCDPPPLSELPGRHHMLEPPVEEGSPVLTPSLPLFCFPSLPGLSSERFLHASLAGGTSSS